MASKCAHSFSQRKSSNAVCDWQQMVMPLKGLAGTDGLKHPWAPLKPSGPGNTEVISFSGQTNLLRDGDDSCILAQNLSFPKMMHFYLSPALWNSIGSWFRFTELFCLVPSMPLAINRSKINNSNVIICFNNVRLCKTSPWHAHLYVGRGKEVNGLLTVTLNKCVLVAFWFSGLFFGIPQFFTVFPAFTSLPTLASEMYSDRY